jgi:lipopolysaccharide export system permease protein
VRLLDRYLLRELLVPLAGCLVGFLVFLVSFDVFAMLEKFRDAQMGPSAIARYYLYSLPGFLNVILPMSLLLALLYALTNHSRHHELTAMRAAGISTWRLMVPYLGVGVLASLLLFAVNEWLAPDGPERAAAMLDKGTGKSSKDDWRRMTFANARDNRTWSIESCNIRTAEMVRPIILWETPDGGRREIYAESARYEEGSWVFANVRDVRYRGTNDPIPQSSALTNRLAFSDWRETPEFIRSEAKIAALSNVRATKGAQLSLREIRTYLELNPDLPSGRRALLRTQFHARLAEPWRCVVVVLMAVPFGMPAGRRNAFVGVASSIFIAFAFFIVQRLALALGTGGYVMPEISAWAPNAVFAAFGLWLTKRVG